MKLNLLSSFSGRGSHDRQSEWDSDSIAERDEAELRATVAFSVNASNAMAAAARITGDIVDISGGVETMAAAVLQLERNAETISASSGETVAIMTETERVARSGAERMRRIAGVSRDSSDALGQTETDTGALRDGVDDILRCVETIIAISNQTRMLAINASIEAAKAGDAGRGFAVVAGQVQTLSGKTQEVTERISGIISRLGEVADRLGGSVGETSARIREAAALSDETVQEFDEVGTRIGRTLSGAEGVEAALKEQTAAIRALTEGAQRISGQSRSCADRTDLMIEAIGDSERHIERRFAELDKREIADYVLHRAKSDHFLWKKKLSEMLVGRNSLTEGELADHHSCRLGKWYDGVKDPALRKHSAFAALEAPHEKVHQSGKSAARRYAAGDVDGAVRDIAEMEKHSTEVVRLLDALIAR